jgi:hypothetical protein
MSSYVTTAYPNTPDLPDPLSRVEEEQEGYIARGQAQLRQLTRDREARAVFLSMAVGFGAGLLLSGAFARKTPPASWRDGLMAEGLGRNLLNRIDQYLPDAVSNRLSS